MRQQEANTPFKPGYSIEDEREAIQSLAGVKGFLMKGRVFTDRADAEGMTVEDIILTELAIAAELVPPYEGNLKAKHNSTDHMLYIKRNIRVLNYEEVLEAMRIKTDQAHESTLHTHHLDFEIWHGRRYFQRCKRKISPACFQQAGFNP